MIGDRLAGQQLAHDGEALIHPQAPGRRVYPAAGDFVAILAAYPNAESEPPRRDLGDVRQLAGYQDGVTQRQQVHAGRNREGGVQHRQRGGLQQPVESRPDEETDMVAAADVVDAFPLSLRQERAGRVLALLEQPLRGEHTDSDGHALTLRSARTGPLSGELPADSPFPAAKVAGSGLVHRANYRDGHGRSRCSATHAAIWARECTSSLRRMFATCDSAVRGAIRRRLAMA